MGHRLLTIDPDLSDMGDGLTTGLDSDLVSERNAMSLEDALNANTAAVLEHNALLKKMLAGAGGKAAAAPATKPAADKSADKPATKPAGTKSTTTKGKGQPTTEEVADKVSKFLKVDDSDVRAERKAQVKQIIDHYGAERFTAIEESDYAEALGFLEAFKRGEDPFDTGSDDGDDDEDEDGMV